MMDDFKKRSIVRKLRELASDMRARADDVRVYDAHVYTSELQEYADVADAIAREIEQCSAKS